MSVKEYMIEEEQGLMSGMLVYTSSKKQKGNGIMSAGEKTAIGSRKKVEPRLMSSAVKMKSLPPTLRKKSPTLSSQVRW